jgi:hypothetical protein
MALSIRAVETAREAEAVFRLRYEVYVEELNRVQHYADHASRLIREPLDTRANLFAAFDGERAVGSVRTNYTRDSSLGEYLSVYQMERLSPELLTDTSITTKLVVSSEYRNTSLGYRLAAATYRSALRDGILFDFIDVYPARIPFFERMGYTVHVPEAVHSEYGSVVVMRLGMRDAEHFRKVGSPFLRYLALEQKAA